MVPMPAGYLIPMDDHYKKRQPSSTEQNFQVEALHGMVALPSRARMLQIAAQAPK
jgi:hypothetical protein